MDNLRRVAVITAASQAIGVGLVAGFPAAGMRVVTNARGLARWMIHTDWKQMPIQV